MNKIKRTVVASGVIGQFDHKWQIIKLYDTKYESESYELFIHEEHFFSAESIVEALANLVNMFRE